MAILDLNAVIREGGNSLTAGAVQTASFPAIVNTINPVNTTAGAVTATLPATPNALDIVRFTDYANKFATNKLTLNPNGLKINGSTANVDITTNNADPSLIYIDATEGWALQVIAGGGGTTTLTPLRIVETDASGALTTAIKNTAYNKNFGKTAGTVVQGNDPRFTPYTQTFNATTDWVANGTNWQITILGTTHLRGTNILNINCFQISGNRRIKVMLGKEFDATTGNVILTVDSNGRFAGVVKIN